MNNQYSPQFSVVRRGCKFEVSGDLDDCKRLPHLILFALLHSLLYDM